MSSISFFPGSGSILNPKNKFKSNQDYNPIFCNIPIFLRKFFFLPKTVRQNEKVYIKSIPYLKNDKMKTMLVFSIKKTADQQPRNRQINPVFSSRKSPSND